MRKIEKAVIFDMDGVIFDSERVVLDCWRIVGERHGIPDIVEQCYKCIGINAQATRKIIMEHYGSDLPYDELRAERSAVFKQKFEAGEVPVKQGAVELLKWLRENNYKIALATSTREDAVKYELKLAGLIDYFDEIVCGDMVSKSKPEPDIFLEAMRRLNVKSGFGIEDSKNGVIASKAAGLHTIMVPDLISPEGLNPDVILNSLSDAPDYIKNHS